MEFKDNRRDDGIENSISLAKCGNKPSVTVRLVVSYFNWIWVHSRYKNTAAQRVGLTQEQWTWNDLVTCPTLI